MSFDTNTKGQPNVGYRITGGTETDRITATDLVAAIDDLTMDENGIITQTGTIPRSFIFGNDANTAEIATVPKNTFVLLANVTFDLISEEGADSSSSQLGNGTSKIVFEDTCDLVVGIETGDATGPKNGNVIYRAENLSYSFYGFFALFARHAKITCHGYFIISGKQNGRLNLINTNPESVLRVICAAHTADPFAQSLGVNFDLNVQSEEILLFVDNISIRDDVTPGGLLGNSIVIPAITVSETAEDFIIRWFDLQELNPRGVYTVEIGKLGKIGTTEQPPLHLRNHTTTHLTQINLDRYGGSRDDTKFILMAQNSGLIVEVRQDVNISLVDSLGNPITGEIRVETDSFSAVPSDTANDIPALTTLEYGNVQDSEVTSEYSIPVTDKVMVATKTNTVDGHLLSSDPVNVASADMKNIRWSAFKFGHEIVYRQPVTLQDEQERNITHGLTVDANVTVTESEVPSVASTDKDIYNMIHKYCIENKIDNPITVIGNIFNFEDVDVNFERDGTLSVTDNEITIPVQSRVTGSTRMLSTGTISLVNTQYDGVIEDVNGTGFVINTPIDNTHLYIEAINSDGTTTKEYAVSTETQKTIRIFGNPLLIVTAKAEGYRAEKYTIDTAISAILNINLQREENVSLSTDISEFTEFAADLRNNAFVTFDTEKLRFVLGDTTVSGIQKSARLFDNRLTTQAGLEFFHKYDTSRVLSENLIYRTTKGYASLDGLIDVDLGVDDNGNNIGESLIHITSDENIIVATHGSIFYVFENGNLVRQFTLFEQIDGEFGGTHSFAIYDRHIWMWNTTTEANKVLCVTLHGTRVPSRDFVTNIDGVLVDPDCGIVSLEDNFWLHDVSNGMVFNYDKEGVESRPNSFMLNSENANAHGITRIGDEYYVLERDGTTFIYSSMGEFVRQVTLSRSSTVLTTAICTDTDQDYVYVAETSGRIFTFLEFDNSNSSISPDFTFDSGLQSIQGITIVDGRIFVLVAGATPHVYCYNLLETGAIGARDQSQEFDLSPSNSSPTGLTWGNDHFWVTDSNDEEVYAYERDGSHTVNEEFNLHFSNISSSGIIFEDNLLHVVDFRTDSIYLYNLDGTSPSKSFPVVIPDSSYCIMVRQNSSLYIYYNPVDDDNFTHWKRYNTAGEQIGSGTVARQGRYIGTIREQGAYNTIDGRPYKIEQDRITINTERIQFTREKQLTSQHPSKFGLYVQDQDLAAYIPPFSNNGRVEIAELLNVTLIDANTEEAIVNRILSNGTVIDAIAESARNKVLPDFTSLDIENKKDTAEILQNLTRQEILEIAVSRDADDDFVLEGSTDSEDMEYTQNTGNLLIVQRGSQSIHAYGDNGAGSFSNRRTNYDIHVQPEDGVPKAVAFYAGRHYITSETKISRYGRDGGSQLKDHSYNFDLDTEITNVKGSAIWQNHLYIVAQKRSTNGHFVFAYTVDGERKPSLDFPLASENDNPTGMTSYRNRLWICDTIDHKIYCYRLTGEHDIELDIAHENQFVSRGISFIQDRLIIADSNPSPDIIRFYNVTITEQSNTLTAEQEQKLDEAVTQSTLARKYLGNRKKVSLTDNTKTYYDDDKTTAILTKTLNDADGNPDAETSLEENPE